MEAKRFFVVRLNQRGVARVLNGHEGMTFAVDKFMEGLAGNIAHVRDYRFPDDKRPYALVSLEAPDYDVVVS